MADAKTITLERYDDLSDVLTRLDYTHAMIGLLTEQKDYSKLPHISRSPYRRCWVLPLMPASCWQAY